jgi:hypothetical protein
MTDIDDGSPDATPAHPTPGGVPVPRATDGPRGLPVPADPSADVADEPASPKKSLSWFEDLALLFIAPVGVFDRRRDAGFGVPLLLLTGLTVALMLATLSAAAPFWDAQYLLTAAQAAERGQEMPTTGQAMAVARYIGVASQLIGIPLVVVVAALLVWLSARLAGVRIGYVQSALIFTLAGFPRLIDTLALGVQGLILDPASIRGMTDGSLGPVRLLDPATTNPVLLGFLANFSLGTLWSWLLVLVGMKVVGRTTWGSAAIGTLITFAIVTGIFTFLPALLG